MDQRRDKGSAITNKTGIDSAFSEQELLKTINENLKNQDTAKWFLNMCLLAEKYMAESRYNKAHDLYIYLLQEQRIHPQKAADSIMFYIYTNVAVTHYVRGNFTEAVEALNSVNEYFEKLSQDKLSVLLLISNVWANMPAMYQPDGYKKALYYLEKAETIARNFVDRENLAKVLNNEGDAYVKLKDWKKSEEKLGVCITLCRRYSLKTLEPALVTLGEAYCAQGKYDLALFYLKEVRNKKSNASEEYYKYGTVKLAETYLNLNNDQKAAPLLAESERIARQEYRNHLLMDIYRLTSTLRHRQGNDKEALDYFQKYHALQDSLNGKDVAKSMQALDLKYKTSEANRKLLERQLFIKKQSQLLDKKNNQIMILALIMTITAISILALYSRTVHKRNLFVQRNKIDLLTATVSGEEKERHRIAQELHDGIGGMLAAVNMNLLTAQKSDFKDERQNNKILQMISDISTEVRRTAHHLLPTALEEHGLVRAIQILCDEISNGIDPIAIDLEASGDLNLIDKTFNTAIYRIIQELLQNTVKHSEASHIVIIMEKNEAEITLHVEDNGKGFSIDDLEHKCLGMHSIKKKVADLGGEIRLDSEVGIGTSTSMLFKYLT